MPIATKKGLIGMYRSALVSGFVNILVFFNTCLNRSIDFFVKFNIL